MSTTAWAEDFEALFVEWHALAPSPLDLHTDGWVEQFRSSATQVADLRRRGLWRRPFHLPFAIESASPRSSSRAGTRPRN